MVRRLPDALLRRSGPRHRPRATCGPRSARNFSDAFKASSTGNDSKQYFVPFYNYPWVVIYRKSVFADKGYTVPKTWDEFKALATKMKADGLTPLAFGDKDGWPAMGTFDILNMRVNGYQYHIELMKGAQKWTDPKTAAVFDAWKELLPFNGDISAALGRTWQDTANLLVQKKAGMYFLGTFAGQQATAQADHDDLDFFPFPTLGHRVRQRARHRRPDRRVHDDRQVADPGGRQGRGHGVPRVPRLRAEPRSPSSSPTRTAWLPGNDADTSGYSAFQKKSAEIIGGSQGDRPVPRP